ncbi:hypothetical protein FKP32DRAFT_1599124 [Trametes sanguinea]|nr:hypothetical protein FKP32DRAFT_1599124 [Trametes sanguinea]
MSSHFLPKNDFATMSDGIGHHRTLASSVWPPAPKGFVDIFDVPERLTGFKPSFYPPRMPSATTQSTERPAVQDLPPPILFDGPARASVGRTAPFHPSQHRRTGEIQRPMVDNAAPPKPSVLVFDGPSRLRPYHARSPFRARAKLSSAALSMATLLVPVGMSLFFAGA